ncbi:MAG: FHA domain-containing protein [Candidatus Brocadiae bacterium]|nr:FHA domain-containing protein [Candidatus Brocadiia bacterium]
MFTILCKQCGSSVTIEEYPESREVKCSFCLHINTLENESLYFPHLKMLQGSEKGKEFPITGVTCLGRGSYNTIQLQERKASRKHAEIRYQNGSYIIEDLKSGNGTFLNKKPVTEAKLQDKDLITIADAVFMFRNPYEYLPESLSSLPAPTIQREAVLTDQSSDFERTRAEVKFDAQHSFLMNLDEIQDITELEKANKKLRIIYEVNHAISSILDLQELLGVILDVVFQYMPAERGAILLYDESKNSLTSSVTKIYNQDSEGTIKISKTILERVVEEKISLLTTDAMVDERLAESMSILSQGIRSAMSVPLISKESLLGVLYIDSTQKSTHFNSETLELLTGIAGQAAIAIENAKLIREIEREIETRGHLQRYLSPELVEQVVNKQIDLQIGGQLKKATVLFSDLRGFTKMTENIGAEAVVAILNDYFSRMVDIIFGNSGTLDKFIGDAIMAIWGLPVSHIEDSLRAVKASLQMQEELFYFNLSQRKMGRNTLKMGVGINVGEVVVGNMGSPKRMEYTVIGPPVNLASRVETLTSRNQILITDNVYNEIKNMGRMVQLSPTHVKGIERAIQIYGVVGVYDKVEKCEINFLPILVPSQKNTTYEGLIQFFDFKKIVFAMEPNQEITAETQGTFSIDIPEIAPNTPVTFLCKKAYNALHGQDEYLKVEADIVSLPEPVSQFFSQVFPLQNFEATIYD